MDWRQVDVCEKKINLDEINLLFGSWIVTNWELKVSCYVTVENCKLTKLTLPSRRYYFSFFRLVRSSS